MSFLTGSFLFGFLHAFLTNLGVAAASLVLGLAIGAPLAWLRHRSRWLGPAAATLTAVLRAAPTFVVMFFLFNVITQDTTILGMDVSIPAVAILILALAIYAAAYVSDNLLDTLRHLETGSLGAAMLFLPNMLRAFIVLIMASSTGAAIGVQEAVTVSLHQADRLPTPGSRIALVLCVILFFAGVTQLARIGARRLTRYVERRSGLGTSEAASAPVVPRAERALTVNELLLVTTNYAWVFLVIMVLIGVSGFVVPLPQQIITIESGPTSGSWYESAVRYRDYLQAHGVRVKLRSRDETFMIVQDVNQVDSGVDVGFVIQNVDPKLVPNITAIGSIDAQPLFIFYRRSLGQLTNLGQLRGLRLAFPARDSATADAALPVLDAFGVYAANSQFSFQPLTQEVAALNSGAADAVFIMLRTDHPLIRELMERDDLSVMNFPQEAAISQHFPGLHGVVIPMGAYDLAKNIPPYNLNMIAGTSQVVVRKTLHPGIVYLLLEAMATADHGTAEGAYDTEYPTMPHSLLPVNEYARNYFKYGLPWVYKELPLWLASIVGYYTVLIVPVILVMPFYRWLGLQQLNEMLAVARVSLWIRTLRDMEKTLATGQPVNRNRLATVRRIRASLEKSDHFGRLRRALERVEDLLKEQAAE